jgi:prepilin signal peptidase PulO-like enzyme (type II secretory pathway)
VHPYPSIGRQELQVTFLIVIMGFAGLLAGALIAFIAPRLVAYRLETPPDFVSPSLIVPLLGPWLARVPPLRPLMFQIATAGLLALLAAHFGATSKLPIAAVYTLLLLSIAYIDVGHRLVLNRLTYPGALLAVLLSLFWPAFSTYFHPLNAALGALVGLLIFGALQLIGRGALGTGDTKLAVVIGAMVGFPSVLSALLLGVVLGGLGAVFFLVILRRGRKTYMAYAPYLAVGAVLYFFTT